MQNRIQDRHTDELTSNAVLTPEQAAAIKSSIPGVGPRRKFRFHMKFVESDNGRRMIEGYASTRDLDRTGDVVQPGAFAESLKDYLSNPVVTYMHDWSNPIGKVIDARIDELGLFIRAEISETADTVWKLIEEGILRALSIGYEVVDEKLIDGVNQILRLRLYEVAIVSIPANRRALFSVSKALEVGDDLVEQHSGEPALSDHGLCEIKTILREVMDSLDAGHSQPANGTLSR